MGYGKYIAVLVALWGMVSGPASAQVIWEENFSYSNGVTTGTNNNAVNPALDWVADCPGCMAGDWFEVRGGVLESRDTNGPAVFETEEIDISGAPFGVEFSVDLEESGLLEGCPGGVSSGCFSVDWIRIEYDLDGNGYQDWSAPTGGPCNGNCAGATYVTLDDFADFTFNVCPIQGSSLRIRITVQSWAADEYFRIDNITVQEQTCNPIVFSDSTVATTCNGTNDGEIWLSVTGAPPPYQFSLDGGPFQSSPFFTGLTPGTYTAVVAYANGARDTLAGIAVAPAPPITLADSTVSPACPGDANGEVWAVQPSGGTAPYTFSLDGSPWQNSPQFGGLPAATYTLAVQDAQGCTDSITNVILSDPLPLVLGTSATPGGCTVAVGTATVLVSGGTPGFTYAWDTPGVNSVATAIGLAPGSYGVTVTDARGCMAVDSATVPPSGPLTLVLAAADTLCDGESQELQGMLTGGTAPLTWSWSCDQPDCGLDSLADNAPLASPSVSTVYAVVVTDTGGCRSNVDTLALEVRPSPSVQAGPDQLICRGDGAQLEMVWLGPPGADSSSTFQWTGPNGALDPDSIFSVSVDPLVSSTYTIEAVQGQCGATDSTTVSVEQPFVHATPESQLVFCPGEPLEIGVAPEAGYSYRWTPGEGLRSPVEALTGVRSAGSTGFVLSIVRDDLQTENCRQQDYPVQLVASDCLLPNAVTPNGDGINDALDFGPYYHRVGLTIFDRWGAVVYESNAYQNDWEGLDGRGNAVPDGVYYYVIRANVWRGAGGTPRMERSGSFTLLR